MFRASLMQLWSLWWEMDATLSSRQIIGYMASQLLGWHLISWGRFPEGSNPSVLSVRLCKIRGTLSVTALAEFLDVLGVLEDVN